MTTVVRLFLGFCNLKLVVGYAKCTIVNLAYSEKGGSYILVVTASSHLLAIYNYAVDMVFLWCQIAHATVTVMGSLNPDLVQDRRPFGNKSSFTNTMKSTYIIYLGAPHIPPIKRNVQKNN